MCPLNTRHEARSKSKRRGALLEGRRSQEASQEASAEFKCVETPACMREKHSAEHAKLMQQPAKRSARAVRCHFSECELLAQWLSCQKSGNFSIPASEAIGAQTISLEPVQVHPYSGRPWILNGFFCNWAACSSSPIPSSKSNFFQDLVFYLTQQSFSQRVAKARIRDREQVRELFQKIAVRRNLLGKPV